MTKHDDENDTPQPFVRARQLFDQAWSLPPKSREAFVRARAGDDQGLADEVLAMIERATKGETDELRERAEMAPDGTERKRIGRYRVLSTLGEGGMGTVYLAEQREPMRRRVALKVLKQGMDSKGFLARFEAERQALAMMEHSCIARVYDAGVSDSGQPYLAMEFVKGVPITTYCDDSKLSIADRIELFVAVCSAIQHAHTKGVMHRDLKPSNILVTVQDGKPQPKVIDFGLAKAVDHRLVEATVFTEVGQVIGTPEYMSPEQAGVGGLDIDARTDVYSLGVLLYQLLTGALPVTREELLRHGYFEMQRVIREGEMQKPSTKITTLGDSATAHAKARRLPVGELQKQLRGELDWIVMKAIEKDRGRRYTTVQELAADLVRFQNDEPVSAGPPSAGYLLRKLAKRHRGPVLAGAGMFVALGVGLAIALWQTGVAQGERDRANDNHARYQKLEGKVKLKQFEQGAAELPPEGPTAVAQMAAWVDAVQAWMDSLPDPRVALAELRTRATQRGEVWEFESGSEQFLNDALVEFVHDLAAFRAPNGTFARVQDSLDWSRRVVRETVDDHADAWQGAKARVRGHPDFAGCMLAPQPGLVPLGADPQSTLEEFWFRRSGDRPERGDKGEFQIKPGTGIVLVLLPGGTFSMGSDGPLAEPNEQPVREVELSPFFMAKYETTQGQWLRWAGSNPSKCQQAGSENHPVESVSWLAVSPLLRRFGLSLPTEAQWEYACRAGAQSEWSLGDRDDLINQHGRGMINIADGFLARAANKQHVPEAIFWKEFNDGCALTTNVGFYEPNQFGLFDMHGNIAEFTRGAASRNYSEVGFAPGDGLILGPDTDRVIQRGGSFWKRAEDARSSARMPVAKDSRYDNVGFRVARALDVH